MLFNRFKNKHTLWLDTYTTIYIKCVCVCSKPSLRSTTWNAINPHLCSMGSIYMLSDPSGWFQWNIWWRRGANHGGSKRGRCWCRNISRGPRLSTSLRGSYRPQLLRSGVVVEHQNRFLIKFLQPMHCKKIDTHKLSLLNYLQFEEYIIYRQTFRLRRQERMSWLLNAK